MISAVPRIKQHCSVLPVKLQRVPLKLLLNHRSYSTVKVFLPQGAGLELKDTRRLDIFPISPVTSPLLFSPKYTGSLYSITSITVLTMLNPTTTIGALISIIEVIDLAKDRSGVQRKYNKKAIIYLWTHKETGKQYCRTAGFYCQC